MGRPGTAWPNGIRVGRLFLSPVARFGLDGPARLRRRPPGRTRAAGGCAAADGGIAPSRLASRKKSRESDAGRKPLGGNPAGAKRLRRGPQPAAGSGAETGGCFSRLARRISRGRLWHIFRAARAGHEMSNVPFSSPRSSFSPLDKTFKGHCARWFLFFPSEPPQPASPDLNVPSESTISRNPQSDPVVLKFHGNRQLVNQDLICHAILLNFSLVKRVALSSGIALCQSPLRRICLCRELLPTRYSTEMLVGIASSSASLRAVRIRAASDFR